jgi:hypothetical protein
MTTQEIANRLIKICRNGDFLKAEEELYAEEVVHIEANGEEFKGLENVLLKEKQFLSKLNKSPLIKISEPLVAGDFFTVRMYLEFDHKELGERIVDEIVVYKVGNGKIVYLKCFY